MSSAPLMFCREAQHAGNGGSLVKCWNEATGHQGSARLLNVMGVSLLSSTDGVAAFEKGTTLSFKPRLAENDNKLTEYGKITLKEH